MYLLFEEGGKFLTGRIIAESESSIQVELDTGKRVKVKSANSLLTFTKPDPPVLLTQAHELTETIDVALAWECAPDEDFAFGELASDYFQQSPTLVEQAATLFALFGHPHYFRRLGKGRFKKAGADVVAQAVVAIERKKQQVLQIEAWANELAAGNCPEPIRTQLYKILFKPDKNAPEYKAVVEGTRKAALAPLALLQRAGAVASEYEFHWQRFLFNSFPKGIAFAPLQAPASVDDLPVAAVQAFSIDDSTTTEIDDALSVTGLGSGTVTLGIHIAAPALAFSPGDPLDIVARSRMSTVYMPGFKVTMLPDSVVQQYTLQEGRACKAVSLYLTIDEESLAISGSRSAIEAVPIVANLRHDQLDALVTEEWLEGESSAEKNREIGHLSNIHGHSLLSFLNKLAKSLKAEREQVRGKPEVFNRPDYNFKLLGKTGDEPIGSEAVEITTRRRGAPLDLIVAECMILANSTWGMWLASLGVPAIYRSQASLAPGVKVRMGTKALPHAGIGVPSYAWSTSPLRRYTDMVNQWQIIAAVKHGATAALAAPFKPKDAALFAIISGFEAAYAEYSAFQGSMERFWTLRYLQQSDMRELDAVVVKDMGECVVRADTLPLVCKLSGATGVARGSRVRISLGHIDLMTLDVSATLIARLGDGAAQSSFAGATTQEADELDEDDSIAGPIEIVMETAETLATIDTAA